MKFWVDAQLPPSLAPWQLQIVFGRTFQEALVLLASGQMIVELG